MNQRKGIAKTVILAVFYIFFPCLISFGQERFSVCGRVCEWINDGYGIKGVRGAIVSLINGPDTLRTQTANDGSYIIKTPRSTESLLTVHHISYKPVGLIIGPVEKDVYAPTIFLEEAQNELDAAKVVAGVPVYEQIGDTLKYNVASTRSVGEDDMLGDVFEKLPGVSKDGDGRFSIMNVPLERVYINGRAIYGDSPDNALKYLPAEEIISIMVYDELRPEEKLGLVRNKDKQRVADVRTKHAIEHALVAQAIGGVGRNIESARDETDNRYQIGAAAKWFSERAIWSVNAYSNNVGRNNEIQSVTDISKIPDRYCKTHYLGTSFSYKEQDYSSFSGSYYYSGDRYLSRTNVVKDYASVIREDRQASLTKSHSGTHRLNLGYMSMKRFVPSARLAVTYSRLCLDSQGETILRLEGADAGGYGQWIGSFGSNFSASPSLYGSISFSDKAGLSYSMNGDFSRGLGNGSQVDTLLIDHSPTKYLTNSGEERINWDMRSAFLYTFSVENNFKALMELLLSRNKEQLKELRYTDYISEANLQNLTSDSHSFNHFKVSVVLGISRGKTNKGLFFDAKAGVSSVSQINEYELPYNENIPRGYLIPNGVLSARYAFDMKNRLGLTFSINGAIPSIEQTSTHIVESNPLYLSTGNPDLDLSTIWSVNLTGDFMPGNGLSISLRTDVGWQDNKIIPVTYRFSEAGTYAGYPVPKGGSLKTYTNIDGAWNADFLAGFKGTFRRISLDYDLALRYDHARNPHYLNDQLNIGIIREPQVSMKLSHSFGRNHPLSVSLRGSRVDVSNTLYQNVGYYQGLVSADSRNTFGKRFFINGKYQFIFRSGGMGITGYSSHMLNAVAGVKVFKNKAGEIALSAFDLMSNSSLFVTTMFGDVTTTSFNPTLGRIWLVSFTYRFNSAKASALEKKAPRTFPLGKDY